jgi:YegS/Rv2252/BmrU family lipid kinase
LPSSRGTLFLNPSSGAKHSKSEMEALKSAAEGMGLEVIRLSREIDCAQTIRERMARGTRLFVAAGGDGTINNIVQPLVNTEATLGVIPVGTYNHFARDLEIPLDWRKALEVVMGGTTRQVDTARVNDRFFVNNISLGLYPALVAKREERGRDYPRWRARLYAAFWTLRKYPHVTLAVESEYHRELVRTHVFMVSNNSYDLSGIGIEAARNTLEGGRLSVYWLPKVSRFRLAKFIAHFLAGRVKTAPGFRSFRTTAMKVQTAHRSVSFGIDGEVLTTAPPLVITIVPKSLLVKVPRND